VPTVVEAMMVSQYRPGKKRGAEICAYTAPTKITAKIPVLTR
jgi:hypothetical protein